MKNKYLTLTVLGLCLAGCTTDPTQFQAANQIVEKPVVVQPPDLKMQYQLNYDNHPALKKAYKKYLKTGKASNIITEGFEQFAYGIGSQPIIAASPLELTVISLEPDEKVTNVSSGDPLRWSYSIAYSGQDKSRQAHIMIKPAQTNISTTLAITTDRRLYTLKLTSTDTGNYVKNARFWYPQEMRDYWGNYNDQQVKKINKEQLDVVAPNVNLNKLNFNYSVKAGWSAPSWKPIRIFDDGKHTYIQFSSSISSRDMPALFVLNGKHQELVNYRAKFPYLVVDKLFEKAILISGNKTVTITNNVY